MVYEVMNSICGRFETVDEFDRLGIIKGELTGMNVKIKNYDVRVIHQLVSLIGVSFEIGVRKLFIF